MISHLQRNQTQELVQGTQPLTQRGEEESTFVTPPLTDMRHSSVGTCVNQGHQDFGHLPNGVHTIGEGVSKTQEVKLGNCAAERVHRFFLKQQEQKRRQERLAAALWNP